MSGTGTRIASISGLRGVVGDGLDPAAAVEFAAAYASDCEPGPIVVPPLGRVTHRLIRSRVSALSGLTSTRTATKYLASSFSAGR